MPTTAKQPSITQKTTSARRNRKRKEPAVRLNTSAEVRAYLAAHLTPVRLGPKGQPIYAMKDIEKLNVIIRPGV